MIDGVGGTPPLTVTVHDVLQNRTHIVLDPPVGIVSFEAQRVANPPVAITDAIRLRVLPRQLLAGERRPTRDVIQRSYFGVQGTRWWWSGL